MGLAVCNEEVLKALRDCMHGPAPTDKHAPAPLPTNSRNMRQNVGTLIRMGQNTQGSFGGVVGRGRE